MKQLLVYVNPAKKWGSRFQSEDVEKLARIQVDNSLRLGWKPEDIIVATNFPWEYNGVRAGIVPDYLHFITRPLSTKTIVANWLTWNALIWQGETCWVHDFDAYQQQPLDVELGINSAAFTTYGWSPKWGLGSYFISQMVGPLLRELVKTIYQEGKEDERCLSKLIRIGAIPEQEYRRLNVTYNFGMRHLKSNYEMADKPLRVLHFHPWYADKSLPYRTLGAFMYGKSELGFPLMDEGLIEVFRDHQIQ